MKHLSSVPSSIPFLQRAVLPIVLVLAAGAGLLLARFPITAVPIAAVAGVIFFATFKRRVEHVFLMSLFGLLVGFAFQSKAFAYLGIPPLFVGEVVLVLGIISVVFGRLRWSFSPTLVLLFAFMALDW
jgi:hypothetical protein